MTGEPETFVAHDGSIRRRVPTGLAERFLRSSFRDRHKPPIETIFKGRFHDHREQVRKDLADLRERRKWNAGL